MRTEYLLYDDISAILFCYTLRVNAQFRGELLSRTIEMKDKSRDFRHEGDGNVARFVRQLLHYFGYSRLLGGVIAPELSLWDAWAASGKIPGRHEKV